MRLSATRSLRSTGGQWDCGSHLSLLVTGSLLPVLLLIGAAGVLVVLVAVVVVVFREVNQTTEVEAAAGYSLPEAVEYVVALLPDEAKRALRRSDVERMVAFCAGLLERAGLALTSRRPTGDELDGEEMVLDARGLVQALREGCALETDDATRAAVAAAFLQYLAAIGAVGDAAD